MAPWTSVSVVDGRHVSEDLRPTTGPLSQSTTVLPPPRSPVGVPKETPVSDPLGPHVTGRTLLVPEPRGNHESPTHTNTSHFQCTLSLFDVLSKEKEEKKISQQTCHKHLFHDVSEKGGQGSPVPFSLGVCDRQVLGGFFHWRLFHSVFVRLGNCPLKQTSTPTQSL